jgi:protein TonB
MNRRISLFPLMIGVSLALHGAVFLLFPGLPAVPSRPAETAGTGRFSLVNIKIPDPPATAIGPEPPLPAAGPPPVPATTTDPAANPAVDPDPAAEPAVDTAPATDTAVAAAEVPGEAAPRGGAAGGAARSAGQGAEERRALVAAYIRHNFDYMQRRIREKLVYPAQARRTGAQGRAEAVFTVYLDGSVGGVEILLSSGQEILDRALIGAIYAAAPFPPPPVQARLVMPLTFRLR